MSQGPEGDLEGLGRLLDLAQRRSQVAVVADAANEVTEQDGTSGEQQGPHRGGVVARALVVDVVGGGEHGLLLEGLETGWSVEAPLRTGLLPRAAPPAGGGGCPAAGAA